MSTSTPPLGPENDQDTHITKKRKKDPSSNSKNSDKKFGKKPNYPWLYRYALPELTSQDYALPPPQMYNKTQAQIRGIEENDKNYPTMYSIEDALVATLRKGYRYTWCTARQSMPNLKYTAIELPPHNARLSYEERSGKTYLSESALVSSSNEGFRSARSNVMVREGDWFYEAKILRGNDSDSGEAHVRVGFTRREAELEAPVGGDGYGYGFRDVNGEKVHFTRPKPYMNEPFRSGDVIGLRINIPRTKQQIKSIPIYRDRFPLKKRSMYFEAIDYVSSKDMTALLTPRQLRHENRKFTPEVIPGSWIRVYKNGKDMGIAFEDLLEFMPPSSQVLKQWEARLGDDGMLGYYPTVSTFKGGMVEINFGPDFDYPIEGSRPISDRYDEMIAEDVTQDIIDEVDFDFQKTQEESAERTIVSQEEKMDRRAREETLSGDEEPVSVRHSPTVPGAASNTTGTEAPVLGTGSVPSPQQQPPSSTTNVQPIVLADNISPTASASLNNLHRPSDDESATRYSTPIATYLSGSTTHTTGDSSKADRMAEMKPENS